jgi:hypothetical protein
VTTLRFAQCYTDGDDFVLPRGTELVVVLDVTPIGDQLRWTMVVRDA